MGTSETLRSVLEAASTTKRLDELSTARVIGQLALKVHGEQQKAGPGKAIGPITPSAVTIASDGELTLSLGEHVGSLGYTAPEAIGGASEGSSDRRSDVFSLGVLMWEALTHQRLFEATNDAAVKAAIKERDITAPGDLNANVPAELSAICMKALARNPADRYQSTKVMAVEIEEMLSEAGYADNNDQIAAYLAERSKAKPPAPQPAKPTGSQPPMAIPKVAPQSAPPSILTTPVPAAPKLPPAASPKMTMLGTAPGPLETKPADDGWDEAAKPTILEAPKQTPAASQPMSPVLPTKPPVREAPPYPIKSAVPPPTPVASKTETNPEAPLSSATTMAGVPPPVPAIANGAADPHPAVVISLPPIPGGNETRRPRSDSTDTRRSQEVLGNWGWQTDSVTAIDDDDDQYLPPPSNKKTLLYLIGGGVGVVLVVLVIVIGFGGSKKKQEPAAAKPSNDLVAKTETAKIDQPTPGSAVGSAEPARIVERAGSGSAAAAVAQPEPAPDTTKPEPVETRPEPAVVEPKVEPKLAPEPKVEPKREPKLEPKPATPDKVAKIEPPKPIKVEPKPPVKPAKPDKIVKVEPKVEPKVESRPPAKPPKQVARIETKPDKTATKSDHKGDKVDVETAYRNGIQQFARGDTTGALTALRTSLAGNPNYPPTWRGLGLVFEKLGEKDQARAAFRRYLQLSPGAGDAEQIRNRLERLGS